jgi:hypothetical protein
VFMAMETEGLQGGAQDTRRVGRHRHSHASSIPHEPSETPLTPAGCRVAAGRPRPARAAALHKELVQLGRLQRRPGRQMRRRIDREEPAMRIGNSKVFQMC